MGLREALLKSGVVDKGAVREAERLLKRDRKAAQGDRAASDQRLREAERAEAEAEAARIEALRLSRDRAAEERQRTQRALQVRQIVLAHRAAVRAGPRPFFVVDGDGRTVHRLRVSESTAWSLRCGELAVASLGAGQLEIVTRAAALRLLDLAPQVVRHFVRDTQGISSPDLVLPADPSEPSLRARRLR